MKFWKTFLASLLALVVGTIVLWIITILILSGIAASFTMSDTSSVKVQPKSVLMLDLGQVTDTPSETPFANFDFQTMTMIPSQSLYDVLTTINTAAKDDNIRGIYLRSGEYTSVTGANLEEIRAALLDFRKSGKFVLAYEQVYSQGGYYLATAADKVLLNPEGALDWRGLSGQIMFYKGLFDKLGIRPQIIRHGTYKSAVEPYITDRMSPANRQQTEQFVGGQWNTLVEAVAESRGLTVPYLQALANNLSINTADDALSYGMVDGLMYEDEAYNLISKYIALSDSLPEADTTGHAVAERFAALIPDNEKTLAEQAEATDTLANMLPEPTTPNIVPLADYMAQMKTTAKHLSKNKVAIVYAEGEIVSGSNSEYGKLGDKTLIKRLRTARDDKNVKAVVLRINSPGGSALAAEMMWREIELLKAKKPVIVSMGSVAASGGYYIAAPADAIVADKLTITGSIGVFGMFMNVGEALQNKLGITVDGVKTNTHADMGSPYRDLDPAETAYMTNSVEHTYSTFVNRVAAGRNLSFEEVDAIGQGRVWGGTDATKIGLVDDFGGLLHAIAIAADRAGVSDDFRVSVVSDELTGIMAILNQAGTEVKARVMHRELGTFYETWQTIQTLESRCGIRAEMPYSLELQY